jgi:hypothetical protein
MCLHIRAHFDGKFFVPDQPVDLPVNQRVDLEVTSADGNGAANGQARPDAAAIEAQLRRLNSLKGLLQGPDIPPESLRRENLYDERT